MIVGLSGHSSHGKDLVGEIIQFLTATNGVEKWEIWKSLGCVGNGCSPFKIVKFADKLKDIICILTNCTRKDLESQEFKSKELGEEWWYFDLCKERYPYIETKQCNGEIWFERAKDRIVKPTYRHLLQYIGADLLRNQLHPNTWINATMIDYRPYGYEKGSNKNMADVLEDIHFNTLNYPNWCITDVRFPNEAKAIKDRDGIIIRINRRIPMTIEDFYDGMKYEMKENFGDGTVKTRQQYDAADWVGCVYNSEDKPYIERMLNGRNAQNGLLGLRLIAHESETSLDDYEFDYVIDNNGTIEDLIVKVKEILIKEKIILKQ